MKRDYRQDARIAIYAMNIRYQHFSFWQHPWIKEPIIPRTNLEKKLYEEEKEKALQRVKVTPNTWILPTGFY